MKNQSKISVKLKLISHLWMLKNFKILIKEKHKLVYTSNIRRQRINILLKTGSRGIVSIAQIKTRTEPNQENMKSYILNIWKIRWSQWVSMMLATTTSPHQLSHMQNSFLLWLGYLLLIDITNILEYPLQSMLSLSCSV